MAERKNQYPITLEGDRKLLGFETYEEYIDDKIESRDVQFLGLIRTARFITSLGYRGNVYREEEFYEHLNAIRNTVCPKVKSLTLASQGLDIQEPVAKALAERELDNRLGNVQTIIFVRTGIIREKSGYIDYAHRLRIEDWKPIFMGKRHIQLKENDLAYFDWSRSKVRSTISDNYEARSNCGSRDGMVFQNRHDHKIVYVNPEKHPGQDTTRHRIFSSLYNQIELYDHYVRKKAGIQ